MEQNRARVKTVLILGGAYISYGVGAQFGSGQGILQYHASLGTWGILSQFIAAALTLALVFVIAADCGKFGMRDMNSVFTHYCGKVIGTLLRWYTVLMLFLFTGTMFAGAGATANESFGIPTALGIGIMLAAVIVTILLGARRLIDILGKIAPIILAAMIVICVFSLVSHTDSLSEGHDIIRAANESFRISPNPILAGILEFSLCILMQAGYVATVASDSSLRKRELTWGNAGGEGAMFLLKMLLIVAFILNASALTGSQVPVLTLGARLGSGFGIFYAIVLELAIYTTASGMGRLVAANILPEDHKFYKPLVVIVTLLAYGWSMLGSFAVLMNIVMTMCSYVGLIFIIGIVVTKLFRQKAMSSARSE